MSTAPARTDADEAPPRPSSGWRLWRYGRALLAPLLLWVLLASVLATPGAGWFSSEQRYDQAALQEWIEEARHPNATLAELAAAYLRDAAAFATLRQRLRTADPQAVRLGDLLLSTLGAQQRVAVKREEIYQHLRALGVPPTKMYPGQLPLFPVIYRLEVRFNAEDVRVPFDLESDDGPTLDDPAVWDAGLDPSSGQYREAWFALGPSADVLVRYQLLRLEQAAARRGAAPPPAVATRPAGHRRQRLRPGLGVAGPGRRARTGAAARAGPAPARTGRTAPPGRGGPPRRNRAATARTAAGHSGRRTPRTWS